MKKIGLSVYSLNVKNDQKDTNINDLVDGKSFIDLVNDYYSANGQNFDDDPQYETVFKFEDVKKQTIKDEYGREVYSYILGTVKTGEYGTESELVEKTTGVTSYNKKETEADVIPFSFMMAIPSGEYSMGIAIFQSEGKNGMKSAFERRMRRYIKKVNSKIKFGFGTIAPKYYVEKIIRDGFLKQIRVLKYDKDDEITNALNINNGVELKEERIFHDPSPFFQKSENLKKLRECLEGKARFDTLVTIPDFEYDSLKFVIKNGEREKTINMTNIDSIVVTIDITNEIGIEAGHPKLANVKPLMIQTAYDYLKQMKLLE